MGQVAALRVQLPGEASGDEAPNPEDTNEGDVISPPPSPVGGEGEEGTEEGQKEAEEGNDEEETDDRAEASPPMTCNGHVRSTLLEADMFSKKHVLIGLGAMAGCGWGGASVFLQGVCISLACRQERCLHMICKMYFVCLWMLSLLDVVPLTYLPSACLGRLAYYISLEREVRSTDACVAAICIACFWEPNLSLLAACALLPVQTMRLL